MVYIKSSEEIEKIRECGIISARLFKHLKKYVEPGITTKELDKISYDFITKNGATPSFKGYDDFPCSICTSVNEEIIHGIPSSRKLKEGDIIGIDVGVKKNNMISDNAFTFPVGKVSEELENLLFRTEQSLYIGISNVKDGNEINKIGGSIEDYILPFGYDIVRDYCGHGVGYYNHEAPEIPNYRFRQGKAKLKKGMVIAIEPMITLGSGKQHVLDDGWTVATVDKKFSAHFEHSVAVTEDGYSILTIEPEDLDSIKKRFGI